MQGCAVQGHNPKWAWLLHLCAFSSSYFSGRQLLLPLFISFCFATSAEGEMLSLFSLWAWSHKNKSLPPLALGQRQTASGHSLVWGTHPDVHDLMEHVRFIKPGPQLEPIIYLSPLRPPLFLTWESQGYFSHPPLYTIRWQKAIPCPF